MYSYDFTLPIQHYIEGKKIKIKIKNLQLGKENIKMSLFPCDMLVYLKNTDTTRINEFLEFPEH